MIETDVTNLAKQVGQTIAKRRLTRGLTQEQVAEQLGIGLEAVSRIERGVVLPTIARLVELADIVECNVAELLTEISTRANDQAQHLTELFSKLNSTDRALMIEVMERLTTRLSCH